MVGGPLTLSPIRFETYYPGSSIQSGIRPYPLWKIGYPSGPDLDLDNRITDPYTDLDSRKNPTG